MSMWEGEYKPNYTFLISALYNKTQQTTRHLPADLLTEILSRLPVKSLLRFWCVSKPWLALVDDDAEFAQLHLKNFKNNSDNTRLILTAAHIDKLECEVRCSDTFELTPEILPPFLTLELGYWETDCCMDGLILLSHLKRRKGHFVDLKLWNPSIGKTHVIPPLLKPGIPLSSFLQGKNIGMGYNPVAKDYKLVKVIVVDDRILHSVAIYDLGVGSWRTIEFQGYDWHWGLNMFPKAVYSRSRLYFISGNGSGDRGLELVWFDLSKEMFSSVQIPDDPIFRSSHYCVWILVSFDGGLTMEGLGRDYKKACVVVWDVDSEFMRWTRLHLFPLPECGLTLIKKNGDLLLERIYIENGWFSRADVELYSHEREELKVLKADFRPSFSISCYVESLILHK